MKEVRTITAALPYVNNVPHIGNIVGSHLPGDIFARYCRLKGHDAIYIGGTDEHGTATEISAQKYGITPKQLCDHFYKIHKEIYDWFEISYDNFSKTSKKVHHDLTIEIFKKVYKNGYIVEKELRLPFCKDCKKQLSDRFIKGTCPFCGYEDARGDQCENCSKILEPVLLKKPKCSVCDGKNIEFKDVKHLFIDLDKLSPRLEKWIKENKQFREQVKKLALAWIQEGLKPRCITRDLKWGIKVPIKGFEDKVFYVWFDAPIGYISSTKEKFPKTWKKYWQDKKAKIYHFVGKDNIPFHTIFWPGTLMANGDYTLPYNVVGLQYLNYERSKFSKSKGHGVFCENLPSAGLDADYWRFYLSYLIPETKDTEFLWNDFKVRVNSDLIGNFSNYINRTLKFIEKNFDGKVKGKVEKTFYNKVEKQTKKILDLYEKVELRQALLEILKLSDIGNKYIDKKKIWVTKDEDVLFNCLGLVKVLGLLIQPFLPNTSGKILKMINCKEKNYDKILKFNVKKIKSPDILFTKLDDDFIKELKKKTSKITEYFKEAKPMVDYEDFSKLDLRVAKIKKAANHPNADKLVVLTIDVGGQEKQIVAGIRKDYTNKQLEGKEIIVVNNLKPVELRGVESNGMLLAASDGDEVVLLKPDKDVKSGVEVK